MDTLQDSSDQRYPDIPGYVIHDELGRGGIATVYLATQESLDRQVALKVISPLLAAEPDYADRFVREGRTVAQLSHPNIITVYDIGLQKHQLFIAMEYIAGGNLRELMKAHLGDAEWALGVAGQIAMALGYAHRCGIVHRDVKPENILFRDSGAAVLTDFGIAKTITSDTNLTRAGTIIGTPKYMSPEQTDGLGNDPRTDVYSLGVILYEMLTGEVPYNSENSMAVLYAHVHSPVPELPEQMADLQPLLNSMMAKDCDERAADCDELAEIIRITRRERHYALREDKPSSREDTTASPQQPPVSKQAPDVAKPAGRNFAAALIQQPIIGASLLVATLIVIGMIAMLLSNQEGASMSVAEREPSSVQPIDTASTNVGPTDGKLSADYAATDATLPADDDTVVAEFEVENMERMAGQEQQQDTAQISAFLADQQQLEATARQPAQQAQTDQQRQPVKLTRRQWQINSLLEQASAAVESGKIYGNSDDTALHLYQQVLELSPSNRRARRGLVVCADHLYKDARALYKSDDMDLALKLVNSGLQAVPGHKQLLTLKKGIEASFNPNSSYARAEKFYLGIDGQQNFQRAAFYYRKAAELGHVLSMNALGVCYANGTGVAQSDRSAIEWFLRAAEEKHAEAMYNLALGYLFSSQRNVEWALPWAEKAAQADYRPAIMLVGYMYTTGTGTQASTVQSIRWDLKGMFNPISTDLNSQYRIPGKWQADFMLAYKTATDSGPNARPEPKTAADLFQ
jgi:serine/threonine protein kinase/TPR repeat protein